MTFNNGDVWFSENHRLATWDHDTRQAADCEYETCAGEPTVAACKTTEHSVRSSTTGLIDRGSLRDFL